MVGNRRLTEERIACIAALVLGLTAVYISLYSSRQTQFQVDQLHNILLHSTSDENLMRSRRSSHPYNIGEYRERLHHITCRRHLDRYLAMDEWRERLDTLVREALARHNMPLPVDKGAKQARLLETPQLIPVTRTTPADHVPVGGHNTGRIQLDEAASIGGEESQSARPASLLLDRSLTSPLPGTSLLDSPLLGLPISGSPFLGSPLPGCTSAGCECLARCLENIRSLDEHDSRGTEHGDTPEEPTMRTADSYDPLAFGRNLHSSNNGASFIRWGKRTCPSPSTTIDNMDGFVSGGIPHTGGGSNLICLPQNIQATQTTAKLNISEGPVIQAAFYRDISESGNERNERERNDGVLLCTQCITSTSQIVKFHGRNTCPSGWTLFYRGHLLGAVSGVNQSLALTSHECLDQDPDTLTPSSRDSRALTLSLVTSGECNDDWCQNYKSGNLVPCVVCGI